MIVIWRGGEKKIIARFLIIDLSPKYRTETRRSRTRKVKRLRKSTRNRKRKRRRDAQKAAIITLENNT